MDIRKTFFIISIIFFVVFTGSCSRQDESLHDNLSSVIEYVLVTSNSENEKISSKEYLGLDISDNFPIATNYEIAFLSDGQESSVNNLVSNLINLVYKKPITVIVDNPEIDLASNLMIQSFPEGSEIIFPEKSSLIEFDLGYPPQLYLIKDNIVANKLRNFVIQDWEEIESFLNYPEETTIINYAEIGNTLPEIRFSNKSEEEIIFKNDEAAILLTLTPDCSICIDVADWLLKQEWPVSPSIVIVNRNFGITKSMEELEKSFSDIVIGEDLYAFFNEIEFYTQERVKGLVDLLNEKFDVFLDNENEIGKLLDVHQHPCMILVDENNFIIDHLYLMLMNRDFLGEGDYVEPLVRINSHNMK